MPPAAVATRVAAIDCGTNSVRLLIADLPADDTALHEVDRRMEIVRLGQGVDRTGLLSAEAIERTRLALVEYAAAIERAGVARVRMVATSASRDAANAGQFTAMVTRTLGIATEVVTGDEEARLSFTGAVRGLPAGLPGPYLVVDIGGGSTEFVRGDAEVSAAISVDIGCVRMTERHLSADPPTPGQIAAARADIDLAIDRAVAALANSHGPGNGAVAANPRGPGNGTPGFGTVIGLAGSVTTVAAIALGLPVYQADRIHHARIDAADVARISGELLSMTRAQRLGLPVMHPGRADVIGAGALILHAILARTGATSVIASEHDILDGIAYGLGSRP